jgi:hypothetical protein
MEGKYRLIEYNHHFHHKIYRIVGDGPRLSVAGSIANVIENQDGNVPGVARSRFE